MIIKQRMGAGKIGSMHLVGNVEGKNVIIVDDIIDTGGTLCEATKVLKEKGALSVSCFATHGLFSGILYIKFQAKHSVILRTQNLTKSLLQIPFQQKKDNKPLIESSDYQWLQFWPKPFSVSKPEPVFHLFSAFLRLDQLKIQHDSFYRSILNLHKNILNR